MLLHRGGSGSTVLASTFLGESGRCRVGTESQGGKGRQRPPSWQALAPVTGCLASPQGPAA